MYTPRSFQGHDYPADSKPHLQMNHVDGPMLVCHCGTPHWLTLWERMSLKIGLTTVEQLDKKYNSDPQKG